MKLVWRQPVLGVAVTGCAWLMAVTIVGGQTAAPAPILAEQVFKNVQVLKGTTVNEFMGTMGAFSAALGMSCEDCHNADDSSWANYAADNPRKQMARVMVTMMAAINKTNFRGRQMVTCYTCHRGQDRPKVTANLAGLYGFPPPEDPPDVVTQAKTAPTADQVFDKYIQAIGGAQRLAALRSYTATGVSVGYGPEAEERPVQIYARAPNQRSTVIQTATGNSTTTYDGTLGWIAAPHRPVDVLPITGQELEGLRVDAALSFPGGIKGMLMQWRVGMLTVIDDKEAHVVQGTGAGGALASLMFDSESGLLLRSIRYGDSPVGRIPVQVDYSDYRDVAGVKMPFKWTQTWLDGRDSFEIKQYQPNVDIEAARFGKPPVPMPPPARR